MNLMKLLQIEKGIILEFYYFLVNILVKNTNLFLQFLTFWKEKIFDNLGILEKYFAKEEMGNKRKKQNKNKDM